jgi:hypothetical protein
LVACPFVPVFFFFFFVFFFFFFFFFLFFFFFFLLCLFPGLHRSSCWGRQCVREPAAGAVCYEYPPCTHVVCAQ